MAAHIRKHVRKLLSKITHPSSRHLCVQKHNKFAKCPERIFSGIQPTGVPHIGNYVGAIKTWLELQRKYDSMFLSIVDLHAITISHDPDILRENIFSITACLLACGIDPNKCVLFQQSTVQEHTQLAWILGCMCSIPQLEHLPQWKEKSESKKTFGVGLFTYPILQAADILLYKSTLIPVGKDQLQHIELSRQLAKTFNRKAGLLFPNPKELLGHIPKIKSLRNPLNKMSKSESNQLGRIDITDSPDEIREKVRKAVTDFTSAVTYEPKTRPGVSNLIEIHEALTEETPDEICEKALLMDTGQYKLKLADIITEKLRPIREEYFRLKTDRGYLQNVLDSGQLKASNIAKQTYDEVQQLVGFK